jgi:hypothetical protein
LGFKVSGNEAPDTVKPCPATAAELMVTADVPVEESVIAWLAREPTLTLPNVRLELLTVSVEEDALSCIAKICVVLPALAVRVTACDEGTAETVALKPAVVAPAGTVTVAGTVTAVLLLVRPIANPPVAAAAFSVTVQLSVPAPVMELLVQVSAVSTGTPVPVMPTIEVVPVEELLLMFSVPVAEPATAGSNCTVNVAV